jgi:hypothetical protein
MCGTDIRASMANARAATQKMVAALAQVAQLACSDQGYARELFWISRQRRGSDATSMERDELQPEES